MVGVICSAVWWLSAVTMPPITWSAVLGRFYGLPGAIAGFVLGCLYLRWFISDDGKSSLSKASPFTRCQRPHQRYLPVQGVRVAAGGSTGTPQITREVKMTDGNRFEKISDSLYFANRALSQSVWKKGSIDNGGSLAHIKVALTEPRDTDFNFGSAAHCILLQPEVFRHKYHVKVLKKDNPVIFEQQKNIRESDEVFFISQDMMDRLIGMSEAIRTMPVEDGGDLVRELLWSGHRELAGFANHPDFGFPMKCLFDSINHDTKTIADIKTESRGTSPYIRRKIYYNNSYHLQRLHYRRMAKWITGDDYRFIHVYIEDQAPYAVTLKEYGDESDEIAAKQFDHVLPDYAVALNTDIWRNKKAIIEPESLPTYADGDGLQ